MFINLVEVHSCLALQVAVVVVGQMGGCRVTCKHYIYIYAICNVESVFF